MKLDLQHNELSKIPPCLLELPNLSELDLSYNHLREIPDIPEWSACLTVLNLSHNQLNSLPINVVASTIHSLDLSFNQFSTVPLCICSFVTLSTLTLSDNPDILSLPAEMGRLNMLTRLNLNNLKDLNDPPLKIRRETKGCIRYLNSKLRCVKEYYRMKLMLVGLANRGKTTLVKHLQGKECGNESTVGVEVSEWWYKPNLRCNLFHFSIWDFGGQKEYYATHQCFLSLNSLYLVLFNLNDGITGVQELKPWLNNIALRAPRSCVIIIGTHLDEVSEEGREEIDALLQHVGVLAESYASKLQIVEMMPVGLKNRIENVGLLKEAIYNHAANYKTKSGQVIMGKKIPASYHALDKRLESVQQEVRNGIREPIMHAEEFNTMVQQMNLPDIQDKDELKTATLFLTDMGSLLHYDDRSHNLHELYFIDPRWLCNMMSKVVTIKERNPFVKRGILYSKYIPLLFKDENFPWEYFEQYLTLLDRFEIALPLDNRRILIPSMLPDDRPTKLLQANSSPGYSRYIIFNSASTPPGFWSRLLSRIMHSIPQVCFALDKTVPTSLIEDQMFDEAPEFQLANLNIGLDATVEPATPYLTQPARNMPQSSSAAESHLNTGEKNRLEASFLPNPPPKISRPLQQEDSSSHFLINAPKLIPNFPSSLPMVINEGFDPSNLQLEYWRTGLYYNDLQVMFRIESFSKCKHVRREQKDGVLIVASPNIHGKKIIGQLVDLVLSLIREWYPGLAEGCHTTNNLEQRVPCFECVKAKRHSPFEFHVDQCLSTITNGQTTIECGYHKDGVIKNHTVLLADIVPDLLLQDIDHSFLLSLHDIYYQEDEASLLGKGGYGKVYRGSYQNKSIAIKKYLTHNEEAFVELRSEAKLLQQLHHPCLVCLVGVCIHPMMALVLEEAPCKSLEFPLLKKKIPIHRLTIFRIAAEVAAALRFLHSQGVIFRDLKAANVLLWTLDPASLCHCKVTDFGIATHMAPVGARGLRGTKGFIAPEVLHIGKRKQRSVYDHTADIFSFGMFLYQVIARRHPYYDIPAHRIDVAVETGERPKLLDVDIATTGYHYLSMLMKKCWEDNPKNRPKVNSIIKSLSAVAMQSVMCVFPVKSKLSLRHAIALTPTDFIKAGAPTTLHNEIWVCCDGKEGAELNIYNAHTMVKISKNFIRDNQVQCMTLCNDHIWVGSRAGIEYGAIDIYNVATQELVHNIRMKENSVSCLTVAKDRVLIGTLEGYCFSFSSDIDKVRENTTPRYKYVSEHPVKGIAWTNEFIWVSHTRYIHFLNPNNLVLEGSLKRDNEKDAFIGQLSVAPAEDFIWSAHVGGVIVTAWDTHNRIHAFDIDMSKALYRIANSMTGQHHVITAMSPALDTIWVGMTTGHIMLFHQEELLTWYRPYSEFVRFLTVIPGSGICEMEKSMVLSGGKCFHPLADDMGSDSEKLDDKGQSLDRAGVLIVWEAYEAKTMRQMRLVEENSPGYLDTHGSVRQTIHNGEFRDGTGLSKIKHMGEQGGGDNVVDTTPYTQDLKAQPNLEYFNMSLPKDSMETLTMGGTHPVGSLRRNSTNFISENQRLPTDSSEPKLSFLEQGTKPQSSIIETGRTFVITGITAASQSTEVFEVLLPESSQVVCVPCHKPPSLKMLLSGLQDNISLSDSECCIEYAKSSGEIVKLHSQRQLDVYMDLPKRPQLFLAASKTKQ